MGFWGSALYSNDTTCDVRDTYKELLAEQLSNEEAYEQTLEQCRGIISSDEEPLFWFALAETQWRAGRLTEEVKRKALEWIEKKGCLDVWDENPKGAAGWQKTIDKLKEKLDQPMPKEKKFRKLEQNPWNLHDVYAYQLNGEHAESELAGKYMLLQKIGEEDRGGRRTRIAMQLQVIDHVFDELPSLEDVNKYRILPMDDIRDKSPERPLSMNGCVLVMKASEYPTKHLTFLGNIQGPVNKHFSNKMIGWSQWLDYHLCHNYLFWQGREYYEVEEGIYNCNLSRDEKGRLVE